MEVWGDFESSALRIQQNIICCLSPPRQGFVFFWWVLNVLATVPYCGKGRGGGGMSSALPRACQECTGCPSRDTSRHWWPLSEADTSGRCSGEPSDLKNLHKWGKTVCLLVKQLNALSGCVPSAIMCCREHCAPHERGSSKLHPP